MCLSNSCEGEQLGEPEEAQNKAYCSDDDTNLGHILGLDKTCT